ncbi:copper resistance protein CopC [Bacillus sp. J37]|uniref:copper resistance CopC family protein n=1 Tax=Bacillus sp. J37 TaxID=935837 RepID=UPI000479C637|nr:copper resistance protein CopC [Bacillus sp. J37]
MKKIVFLISVLWMLPFMVSAHTTVSNSTPEEGQAIKEELSSMKVEFAGEIEKQSTLTLKQNDTEIPLDSITVNEKEIIGTVTTPLTNGSYVLTWKIAAKDGHAMTGDIPFTVEIPETKKTETEETEVTESEAPKLKESTEQSRENTLEEPHYNETNSSEDSNSSTFATVSVIVLIILLIGGIWVIFRKKR